MESDYKSQLNNILQKASQLKLLVVGDCILDHYVWGDATRISPEAPVPIVAIEKTGNDTVAYYYNKDDSTWVDSIENATHFEKYDDAFNVWYQLANKNKENKERFARIFIPTMNENLLTEGIMDFDYADYYDGPGYYKFSFAISKPIDTKIPGVEGETISEYEDYQMISITSEKDFVDYITYELSLNEFRTFMGAFKMRDFYDYENSQESSNT